MTISTSWRRKPPKDYYTSDRRLRKNCTISITRITSRHLLIKILRRLGHRRPILTSIFHVFKTLALITSWSLKKTSAQWTDCPCTCIAYTIELAAPISWSVVFARPSATKLIGLSLLHLQLRKSHLDKIQADRHHPASCRSRPKRKWPSLKC